MRSGDVVGGKYRLEDRIGTGGYGDVWRAVGLAEGTQDSEVAIKEFRDGVNVRELELLARLSHPNVIALLGIESHEGRHCIVMEYADGGSAAAMLRSYPSGVPPEQVARVVLDVAAGLDYLHAEGVVHRDVKPANVVLSDGVAKLCDMGLAKTLDGSAATHTGHGTFAYTAPELFLAGARATPACDLYALGVLAYELATGALPYGAEDAAIYAETLSPAPIVLPRSIPPRLATALAGCLEKIPSQRWTAAQVRSHFSPAPEPAPSPPSSADRVATEPPAHAGARQPGTVEHFAGMRFRFIPKGRFSVLAPGEDETSVLTASRHDITLSRSFWLGEAPVALAEYVRVVGELSSGRAASGGAVVGVSWHDAVAFANALSRAEGLPECYRVAGDEVEFEGLECRGYRLPTVAEWEYARAAGQRGAGDVRESRRPNAWGLRDMQGALWQWCHDRHSAWSPGRSVDPTGPTNGQERVARGGVWELGPEAMQGVGRYHWSPERRLGVLGFRLARTDS